MNLKSSPEEKTITIDRTGKPALRFEGSHISTRDDRIVWGQDRSRWHILSLYTAAKGYVAVVEYVSQWEGEAGNVDARLCATGEAVIEFLGHGALAKEVYADADIEDVEVLA